MGVAESGVEKTNSTIGAASLTFLRPTSRRFYYSYQFVMEPSGR